MTDTNVTISPMLPYTPHRYAASLLFDVPEADVLMWQRQAAKTLFFAYLDNGVTDVVVSTLGLSCPEAQVLYGRFVAMLRANMDDDRLWHDYNRMPKVEFLPSFIVRRLLKESAP